MRATSSHSDLGCHYFLRRGVKPNYLLPELILYNAFSPFSIYRSPFLHPRVHHYLPVIAALYLVLTFVAVSAYLIVSGAAFLGLVYLLVYVGAIAVLFLFVVILLDTQAITVNEATTKSSFSYELAFALLVAASVTALVALSPATT